MLRTAASKLSLEKSSEVPKSTSYSSSSDFYSMSARLIHLPHKRQISIHSQSTVTSHPLSRQTCSATGYFDSVQLFFWHHIRVILARNKNQNNKNFFIGKKLIDKIIIYNIEIYQLKTIKYEIKKSYKNWLIIINEYN
jgi:hypothetical protein